jgi:hypothetical protein
LNLGRRSAHRRHPLPAPRRRCPSSPPRRRWSSLASWGSPRCGGGVRQGLVLMLTWAQVWLEAPSPRNRRADAGRRDLQPQPQAAFLLRPPGALRRGWHGRRRRRRRRRRVRLCDRGAGRQGGARPHRAAEHQVGWVGAGPLGSARRWTEQRQHAPAEAGCSLTPTAAPPQRCTPTVSVPREALLVLQPAPNGGAPAAALVFRLRSAVRTRAALRCVEVSSPLYEMALFEVHVVNPYPAGAQGHGPLRRMRWAGRWAGGGCWRRSSRVGGEGHQCWAAADPCAPPHATQNAATRLRLHGGSAARAAGGRTRSAARARARPRRTRQGRQRRQGARAGGGGGGGGRRRRRSGRAARSPALRRRPRAPAPARRRGRQAAGLLPAVRAGNLPGGAGAAGRRVRGVLFRAAGRRGPTGAAAGAQSGRRARRRHAGAWVGRALAASLRLA